jgi:hypothetical protein
LGAIVDYGATVNLRHKEVIYSHETFLIFLQKYMISNTVMAAKIVYFCLNFYPELGAKLRGLVQNSLWRGSLWRRFTVLYLIVPGAIRNNCSIIIYEHGAEHLLRVITKELQIKESTGENSALRRDLMRATKKHPTHQALSQT